MAAEQVSLRIYGETYTLRTDEDPGYAEEVAGYVDARMREVAASGKVVVTSRIAVLAAMHIADELLKLRREVERSRGEDDSRLGTLASRLAAAIEGTGRA